MRFVRHNKFKKSYKKRIARYESLIRQLDERLKLFEINPAEPVLKDHALKGNFKGLRAFSITGDIRIIYKKITDDLIMFYDIGTHNQVYR